MSNNNDTVILHKIMGFIDDHSQELPEGEYLEMCNKLRDMFRHQRPQRVRTLPDSLLRINAMDTIYERCMVLVRNRKFLKKCLYFTKPRIRVSKNVKREALHAYCGAMELPLCETIEELNELGHNPQPDFFSDYLELVNLHRRRQREFYIKKLDDIENEMTTICNFITATQRITDAFYAVQVDVPALS